MIRIRGLTKSFGSHVVLTGIDFDIQPQQVVVVIGPSGSGKSTFLRCCNGLEHAEGGTIDICGRRLVDQGTMLGERALNALRTEVGMVFQSFNLFPHLTVLHNITVGPRMLRAQSKDDAEAAALALLDKVGLAEKAHAMPASLSGGQKQRVAIARALAMEPDIMLFDEPTSALDPELVGEVLRVMRDLAAEGRTMIVVTHEMGFAREVSNHCLFLHQGKVEEEGNPKEMLLRPQCERLQQFLSGGLK
ncbi:MAG: amino acid ABC transporter ATP-binding protein [Burkholderiales bacterium]|nr:amino acid ABC transporter ATP-binding protein [Burkholderiales bacterium]